MMLRVRSVPAVYLIFRRTNLFPSRFFRTIFSYSVMHSVYALAIHRICGSYRFTAMPLNVVFSHFGNKQRVT